MSMTLERITAARQAAAAYSGFTVGTAQYPAIFPQHEQSASAGLIYVALGLGNEVGELAEHLGPTPQSDVDRLERYAKGWKELGDVQWYAARIFFEVRLLATYEEMVNRAMNEVYGVDSIVRMSGFELQSELSQHAGIIQGVVKKMIRDGEGWDLGKYRTKIAELEGALYKLIRATVFYAEFTGPIVGTPGGFVHLLRCNSDKLQGRVEAGTIKGDGDVR